MSLSLGARGAGYDRAPSTAPQHHRTRRYVSWGCPVRLDAGPCAGLERAWVVEVEVEVGYVNEHDGGLLVVLSWSLKDTENTRRRSVLNLDHSYPSTSPRPKPSTSVYSSILTGRPHPHSRGHLKLPTCQAAARRWSDATGPLAASVCPWRSVPPPWRGCWWSPPPGVPSPCP